MSATFIACLGMVLWAMHGPYAHTSPSANPKSNHEDQAEVAALIKALADPKTRGQAVLGLRAMGPRAKAAIPALIALLSLDDDADHIYKALAAMGPEAIPLLIELFKNRDARRRARAAWALQSFGPRYGGDGYRHRSGEPIWVKSAIPTLIGALADQSPSVAVAATHALAAIGPDAKDAVPALIKALADDSLRLPAMSALSSIGPGAGKAVPAIAEMLKDESVTIRLTAVSALGEIGAGNNASVPALLSALSNDALPVRSWAVFALGQIGSNAKAALPALVEKLKDNDLREEAGVAIRRIGPDAGTVPALIELLKHKTLRVRQLAATALAHIGADAKEAVPALIQCLRDEPNRQFAVHALGRIGPEAKPAVPILAQMLKNELYYIRAGAAEALGQIGPNAKSAVGELIQATHDEHAQVRHYATHALKQIDPEAAKNSPSNP